MKAALRVEWWKFRRSRVTQVATALMALLLPALGLGFYSVARSGGAGTLAGKADALLTGEGWAGYLGLVDQIAAVALFLGAGVVVAWTFGREHADRTFPALYALPVPRSVIAGAKFVVLAGWVVVLSVIVSLVAVAIGLVGDVGHAEWAVIAPEALRLIAVSLGAGVLSLTMGYVASLGRGYLAPVGALMVMIAITQVAVLFGTGGWFPFAVPGLMAVAGAEGIPKLSPAQLALVPAIAALGIWATIGWWRNAEVV